MNDCDCGNLTCDLNVAESSLRELVGIASELLAKWDRERERGVKMKSADWRPLRAFLAEHAPQSTGATS